MDGCTPCSLFICLPPEDISNLSTWSLVSHTLVRHLWTHFPDICVIFIYLLFLSAWYSHSLHTDWIVCPQICHFVSGFPDARWSYHRELINLSLLQVTQDPRVVLPLRWDELVEDEGANLQLVFSSMAKQIQSLLAQRDTHLEVHMHILEWSFGIYPYCSHTWVKVKISGWDDSKKVCCIKCTYVSKVFFGTWILKLQEEVNYTNIYVLVYFGLTNYQIWYSRLFEISFFFSSNGRWMLLNVFK